MPSTRASRMANTTSATTTTVTTTTGPAAGAAAQACDVQPSGAPADRSARRALRLLRPHRRAILGTAAVIVVSGGLGTLVPLLVRDLFDHGLFGAGGVHQARMLADAALITLVTLASGALSVSESVLANRTGLQVAQRLRSDLYAHLQAQAVSFFADRRNGDIQTRLASDVDAVRDVIGRSAADALGNLALVASTLAGLLLLCWPLALVSIVTVPGCVAVSRLVGRRRRMLTEEIAQAQSDLSSHAQDTLSLSGAQLAKLFGRQDAELARYRERSLALGLLQARQAVGAQSFAGIVQTCLSILPVAVYLVAGVLLAHGDGAVLTAGTLIAATSLQARVFFPLSQLMATGAAAQSAMVAFRRIFDYLDLVPQVQDRPDAAALAPQQVRGGLSFHEVCFRYTAGAGSESARHLSELSLEVEPGSFTAIVGPSGAGKSTLAALAARLYDPNSGAVRLDGKDLRTLRQLDLRRAVCLVSQETYLLHATIEENLRYARPGASDAELVAATRAVGLHDRIAALPDGYATVVGARGHRMSGGERQRLAIARALVRRPRVLILDEATSSLDSISEELVQRTLAEGAGARTTLAIAHRLSTIRHADRIFVLDGGALAESGTHAQLLARGGLYARLHARQNAEGKPGQEQAPDARRDEEHAGQQGGPPGRQPVEAHRAANDGWR
ncbi:ABC transporter ATP-binding protein [Actinospica robiniae]|uniref:ABC transporter ATP-binding protein n=1 Tax=Actinospica robiniae TaxID=304901 RepID=UPI000A009AA2|nr:ABC transporter ATP-binding protein [Actinospica robiniae]